jgi:hypothetical protein
MTRYSFKIGSDDATEKDEPVVLYTCDSQPDDADRANDLADKLFSIWRENKIINTRTGNCYRTELMQLP